jgi:L,D-transpeptidase catalytic domain
MEFGRRDAIPSGMKTIQDKQNRKMAGIAALLMISAAGASAQPACGTCRILVSIPDRKLVLLDGGHVLKIYDVAVGTPSTPSPVGEFHIVAHVANPTWYGHHKVIPAGPHNPVGTRWMGLSVKGYGIHGTNAPGSIGKAASHGCIRMRNRDVEELFALVGVGVPVDLIDRPQAAPVTGSHAPGSGQLRQISAVRPPQASHQSQTPQGE